MFLCDQLLFHGWKFSTLNINVSDSCEAAIQRLSELEVSDPQLMAYYWDSWGKSSDGVLTGTLHSLVTMMSVLIYRILHWEKQSTAYIQ